MSRCNENLSFCSKMPSHGKINAITRVNIVLRPTKQLCTGHVVRKLSRKILLKIHKKCFNTIQKLFLTLFAGSLSSVYWTSVHERVLTCTKVLLQPRNLSEKFPKFIKILLKWSKALPYLLIHLFAWRRNEAKREINQQCEIRGVFSLKRLTRDSAKDKRFKREIQQQRQICLPFQTARKAFDQISLL